MNARPYSIRDLRTLFKGETLRRDCGGDYDYQTRRWRFSSIDGAREARRIVRGVELHTLHDPDAVLKVDSIRARNGISIVARNDEGANKRGTAFYVFENEIDRFQAERHLFPHTRAGNDAVRAARSLAATAREYVSPAIGDEVASWDSSAPARRAVMTVVARCNAATASYPQRAADAAESIGDVVRSAIAFLPEFEPIEDVGERVTGLLVARSAHHLAVQTHDDGRGVILDRWKIAMPLAQTDANGREVSFDVRSAIGVEFDGDGFGSALQIARSRHAGADSSSSDDARDLTIGALRIEAMFAARKAGVLPILHHEELQMDEDLDGMIVAADEHLGVLLDRGAVSVIGYRKHITGGVGESLSRGPSFPAPQRSLTHSR
jgi:hypothetical protein